MNIENLKYFSEVAILKSISKVANKSHISQPALSNQLSKLENELGVKLFERSNKGVELTEYGEILLSHSKGILNEHNNLVKEIHNKKNNSKEIKISTNNTESNILVCNLCTSLIEIFDGFNIIVDKNQKNNEQSSILYKNSDVIVGKQDISDNELCSKYIGSDSFVLVSKRNIESINAKNYKFIAYDDEFLNEEFFKMDIADKFKFKTNSLSVIKQYVKQKDVIAFLPRISVKKELEDGTLKEVLREKYEISYDFYVTYRKDLDSELKGKINYLIKELKIELTGLK